MFMNYNMKILTMTAMMTKTHKSVFIMNNLKIAVRIHFAGNLYLTIRNIFLISKIFCLSKAFFFCMFSQ